MGIIVLLLTAALVESFRLRSAADQLARAQRELSDSSTALGSEPGSWNEERVVSAAALQAEGLRDMTGAREALDSDPVLSAIRFIPVVKDQVGATRDLALAGQAGALAVGDEISVARAYLGARTVDAPAGKRLLALIKATTAPLEHARSVLETPVRNLEADRTRALAPPLADRVVRAVHQLRPRLDQASALAGVGRYLPDVLGATGPRTYLLLLPNPAELRPAGGFAGAVGSISFVAGTPGAPDIQDEDQLDQKVHGSFPPPADIAHYMKFPYGRLDLGDNLDPQFPRQAATSEALYKSATGLPTDGTISLDPYATSAVLGITGPVDVAGYGRFDAPNFFQRLNEIVNAQRGAGSGKGALIPISKAILERLLALPLRSYPQLLATLQDQARQRHIQFALHDQSAAMAAARAGYDGSLINATDDYLLVTEANIGGTKGDYFLHRSMSLRAEIIPGGLSHHELVMHYDMPAAVNEIDRRLNPLAGSYQDYFRVYLPETATLRQLTYRQDNGQPRGALDSISTDLGRKVIGSFFVLPRGHRAELRLEYDVPLHGLLSDQIYVQKQPGGPGYPMQIEISYPGKVITRAMLADRDRMLDLSW